MAAQLELPYFITKPSEDFAEWLVVTCPREDCGEKPFFVHRATWMSKRYTRPSSTSGTRTLIIARSCPYCFKAARIPRSGRRTR